MEQITEITPTEPIYACEYYKGIDRVVNQIWEQEHPEDIVQEVAYWVRFFEILLGEVPDDGANGHWSERDPTPANPKSIKEVGEFHYKLKIW